MKDNPTVACGPKPVTGRRPSPTARFRILFVFTGNRCRSPFAELFGRRLVQQRLGGQAARFDIGSAGVQAEVGHGLDQQTRRQLRKWGFGEDALDAFSTRQIDEQMVADADLVLTMTAPQRSIVLDEVPQALARTFVLRELARFGPVLDLATLPSDPMLRARAIVARGGTARARVPARNPTDDDIDDPIGRLSRTHRMVARTVGTAVGTIVDMLVGQSKQPASYPAADGWCASGQGPP
jgi:protein-tyrosine phosphatase